jgi:ATP synthase F1 delta subunit
VNKAQIAKKFSKALIATTDISSVPRVIEELKAFSRLISAERKIRILFTSQIFSDNEKMKSMDEILSYMKASDDTGRFLKLMTIEGTLSVLTETIQAVVLLYEEKLKKVTAEVAAPVTLEEQYLSRLKAALSSLTGRDVEVESLVDPSLIGGFVVKVGSTVYDSSLKGQLQALRAELTRH